ncbi:MAG TPA: oligosaccharide flippase family protein [Alphaproteobacteria bacterium]|nr:oligosaccharide flippase family protein [Alphaproteobacteria bacterium]
MLIWLRTHFGKSFVGNISALTVAHAINVALPLLMIPFLARTLGPDGFGVVALAQSFGFYITRVVEFGFDFTGAREVARHRSDPVALGRVLGGVMGSKALLTVLALGLAALGAWIVPPFRENPAVFWSGFLWGLGLALSMIWYFQGLELMTRAVFADLAFKAAAAVGTVLAVDHPGDAWLYLAFHGVATLAAAGVGLALAWRVSKPVVPSLTSIFRILADSFAMFLFRLSEGLYTVGTPFLLGLLAPPSLVGYLAGADRIARAATRLIAPIGVAVFPHVSHLAHQSRSAAAATGRATLLLFVSVGFAISLVLLAFTPLIVDVLLGPDFERSRISLQILALLPLVSACSHALGYQWMVPLGLDRPFVAIAFATGLLHVLLAILLVSVWDDLGMAVAILATEAIGVVAIFAVLRIRRLDPFSL